MGLEKEDLRKRQNEEAIVNHWANIFNERLSEFLKGDSQATYLFAGDYDSDLSNGLSYAYEGKKFGKLLVNEIKLTRRFRKIIENRVISDIPDVANYQKYPKPITKKLKDFIETNPQTKINVQAFIYQADLFSEGIVTIAFNKYQNPKNGEILTGAWLANRLKRESDSIDQSVGLEVPIAA